jgi:hypothetical protein
MQLHVDESSGQTTMILMMPDAWFHEEYETPPRSPMPSRDQVLASVDDLGNYDQDDMCPVCLCSLKELEDVVRIKNCGHVYCDPCITTWLYDRNARECAVCKRDVRGSSNKRDRDSRDYYSDDDEEPPPSARRQRITRDANGGRT